MANYLEQLVSEWYEFQGYFVRKNVLVGKRAAGGYDCELDVVAFNPKKSKLVQIEPSMDSHKWERREARYTKKFNAGKEHIPQLFKGLDIPDTIEQIALFGLIGKRHPESIGGGKVITIREFLTDISRETSKHVAAKNIISEQYPLLRTIMFMLEHNVRVPSE